jgi:hypothetical protein
MYSASTHRVGLLKDETEDAGNCPLSLITQMSVSGATSLPTAVFTCTVIYINLYNVPVK